MVWDICLMIMLTLFIMDWTWQTAALGQISFIPIWFGGMLKSSTLAAPTNINQRCEIIAMLTKVQRTGTSTFAYYL